MGDESTIAPPRSKNVCMTGTSGASVVGAGATLKVIQVPRPMTGSRSPLPALSGMARVIGEVLCEDAIPGRPCAVAAHSEAKKRRREIGVTAVLVPASLGPCGCKESSAVEPGLLPRFCPFKPLFDITWHRNPLKPAGPHPPFE